MCKLAYLLFFAMCMIVFLCNVQDSKLYIMLASKLKMFKKASSFFSFEKCHFCFLSKIPNQQGTMFYMRQANNLASVTFVSFLQMCKKVSKFLHFLDLCKVANLSLRLPFTSIQDSTLATLSLPLSLAKRKEDSSYEYQNNNFIMNISSLCASLLHA